MLSKMRTKSGEKKRYNLRNIERKDFRTEQEVLAAVRRESIDFLKAYEELHVHAPPSRKDVPKVQKVEVETTAPSGSTKRKRSKPEKTLKKKVDVRNKENVTTTDDNITSSKITPIEKKSTPNENKSTPDENKSTPVKISTLDEKKSTPNEKKSTPIEKKRTGEMKTTPKPSEKKEQVASQPQENPKLSTASVHPVNEVSYRKESENIITDEIHVYSALGHASCCKFTDCRVPKCAIAKHFLSHSSTCIKGSTSCNICKAMDIMVKKHGYACDKALFNDNNSQVGTLLFPYNLENCTVPKCDKVRRDVLRDWVKRKCEHNTMMEKVFLRQEEFNISAAIRHAVQCDEADTCRTTKFVIYYVQYVKQLQNEYEMIKRKNQEAERERQNQLFDSRQQQFPPFGNIPNHPLLSQPFMAPPYAGLQNMAVPPMMYPNPWGNDFMSTPNTSQYFYPNAAMPYPSLSFGQDTPNPQSQDMCDPNISEQFEGPVDSTANGSDASISYPIADHEEEQHFEDYSDGEQQDDLYQVSTPHTVDVNQKKDLFSYPPNFPTREMYDKKNFAEKAEDNTTYGRQLLSPITDCRASFSEVQPHQPIQNGYFLGSQEEEMEEDPILQSCVKSNMVLSAGNQGRPEQYEKYYVAMQNLKENSYNKTEEQSEWGKIDFVKQQMMEEVDIETETADESEGDAGNTHRFLQPLPIAEEEKPAVVGEQKYDRWTPMERYFWCTMKDQKQEKNSY